MSIFYEIYIGLVYVRGRRAAQSNAFVSFISSVSILGIALGVAALIVVLSVMNGFQIEVRDRMLSVVSHIDIVAASGGQIANHKELITKIKKHPDVVAAAPYVNIGALVIRDDQLEPILIRGIDTTVEPSVSALAASLEKSVLDRLVPGQRQIVIGDELAKLLNIKIGDNITITMSRQNNNNPLHGIRLKTFQIIGIFRSGHYKYDRGLAWIPIVDAMTLLEVGEPTGIQVKVSDRDRAVFVSQQLYELLGNEFMVRDWTRTNEQWFEALAIQKRMFFLILALMVAVAAFNLVATLVMTVTDKRADIAILRTLGATPYSIMLIFIVQGTVVGFIGTIAGVIFGYVVSTNLDFLVPTIEHILGTHFLPSSVYFIDHMPSDIRASDVCGVILVALSLSLAATIYPSCRAGMIRPAEALRYE